MKLCIAGLVLQIECDTWVAQKLFNLYPFLSKESVSSEEISDIKTECVLKEETGKPLLEGVMENKTFQIWLSPQSCCIRLTIHHVKQIFLLRADRHWRLVETNWTYLTDSSLIALNDFIMLTYIYSSSFHQVSLIHASSVYIGKEGCAFIGPSGIGKSTHSRLWLDNYPEAKLLNDDQPILRILSDGNVYIYGSPWSGKTPCYQNKGVRLKALFFLEQAGYNRIAPLDGIEAYQRLLQATSMMRWDMASFAAITETQARVISAIPVFKLENLPVKAAADLSYHEFRSF